LKKLFLFILLLRILPLTAQKDSVNKFYWSAGIVGGVNNNANGFATNFHNSDFLGKDSTSIVTGISTDKGIKRNIGSKFSLKYRKKEFTFSLSSYFHYYESSFAITNGSTSSGVSHSSSSRETISVNNFIFLNQYELSFLTSAAFLYIGTGLTYNLELVKNYNAHITKSGYYSGVGSVPNSPTGLGWTSSSYTSPSEPYEFKNYSKLHYISFSLFISKPIKKIKSSVFARVNFTPSYHHFMFNLGFDKNFYFKKKSKQIKN